MARGMIVTVFEPPLQPGNGATQCPGQDEETKDGDESDDSKEDIAHYFTP